jgi:hypothetical protein
MSLTNRVQISRRFQRSVRVDSDLHDILSLKGFVCPQSSSEVLVTMAQYVEEMEHSAFTWTGPYGSGKSSLAVALSALLAGEKGLKKAAAIAIGPNTAKTVWGKLAAHSKGWRVLPVVGRRESPTAVIGEAIESAGLGTRGKAKRWTETRIVSVLKEAATKHPEHEGGLLLIIDEMGKFLEAAAQEEGDVYLFQQLAEMASRSRGRLIIVGILHQAFEEYANRLMRDVRDEWSKIQGRFVDLAINIAGEEQIELLGRAIESDRVIAKPGSSASKVATAIRTRRPSASKHLACALEACWPLHPIVASLLGPISRRRFGQNQRSIFGFLSSSEPDGFQDFLRQSEDDCYYEPHRLWNYLRSNLEPSILASPDGHRWALVCEATERCEALGGSELHLGLLKTIGLIELFKERSGLEASVAILQAAGDVQTKKDIQNALAQLKAWSLVIYKNFASTYAIYAGSDFDIEEAVEQELERVKEIDFSELRELGRLHPILAKRHYHETGAQRWFEIELVPLSQIVTRADTFEPKSDSIGQFLLAMPTEGETKKSAQRSCQTASSRAKGTDIVVGLSQRSWVVTALAQELLALERVSEERPELSGDAVARRELRARFASLQGRLETELLRAFHSAEWYLKPKSTKRLTHAELNSLASDLADQRFHSAPHIHNELLNRTKPTAPAVSAQNALFRKMVSDEGKPRLGIEGFPAEGGLFDSLLKASGLYRESTTGWCFVSPDPTHGDPRQLESLWKAATGYLEADKNNSVNVSDIYDLWGEPPFGVKNGLMPILVVAFILSHREKLAIYRQGLFQAQFKVLDVEYLAKNPSDIQLRWMDLSGASKQLLSSMAEVVRDLDSGNALADLAPIDVARGLIAIYDSLHPWTKRTMQLSENAIKIRDIFKHASDPNKLLFDDLPNALDGNAGLKANENLKTLAANVREGLEELLQAYPTLLRQVRYMMLADLQVPNNSPRALAELSERAQNILQLTGDFQLDAFAGRLCGFKENDQEMEGIVSLAVNKPPASWVDPDLDRARIEIANYARQFIRAETFAQIKGRSAKRHAMAVVVGKADGMTPTLAEFDIADGDHIAVNDLIARLTFAIGKEEEHRDSVILAALSAVSLLYMRSDDEPDLVAEVKAAS